MSRHRRKRHEHSAAVAASTAMMAAVCERLAKDFKLSPTDPRIEQASVYKANQLLWEQRIAAGEAIPSAELSSYSDIISRLLGSPPAAFTVRYVDGYICSRCKEISDGEEAAALAAAQKLAAAEATKEPLSNTYR